MRWYLIIALTVIQLGVFSAVLWNSAERGHVAGQAAALSIAPGLQVLIGLLLVGTNTGSRSALRESLVVILIVYHTVILPVGLATPGSDTQTRVWEGTIGGILVALNHTIFILVFAPEDNKSSKFSLTGTHW
jgi:hypothetical protein